MPLLVLLLASTGCVLKWDRQWPDGGSATDSNKAADGIDAADSSRPKDGPADTQPPAPDAVVIAPDLGLVPCKGKPTTHVCRPAKGPCDVAETCDGKGHACPPNKLRASGHLCRAAAGGCDLQETCSGKSAQCPTNRYQPATKVCRVTTGACDPTERCTGKSPGCPADVKWAQKNLAYSTTSGTDGHIVKTASTGQLWVQKDHVRVYCKTSKESSIVKKVQGRGFLSFNTTWLPKNAVLLGAQITGCHMVVGNYSNGASIDLYSASFKVPLGVASYKASLTNLKTKLPSKKGVNTFTVPVTSVKPGGLTQYVLLWPITNCTAFSGQVWSGAGNTATKGLCNKAPYPWKLTVSHCGP